MVWTVATLLMDPPELPPVDLLFLLLRLLLGGRRRRGLGGLLLCGSGLVPGNFPEDPLHPDGPLFRIVDRRLHHPHEDGVLAGRLVGLDDVQRLPGLEDPRVVLAVLA